MNKILNKIYKGSVESFFKGLSKKIQNKDNFSIVTVNSEHLQMSNKNLSQFYLSDNTILVADGIAVTLMSKLKKNNEVNKITGVSITEFLLTYANDHKKSIGILGASAESLEYFKKYIDNNFPQIREIIYTDGFVKNKENVLHSYAEKRLDFIFLALGVPAQEILIKDNIQHFEKSVLIGIGGSIDVLGGYKKRAPKFFLDTNTEWLYRVFKEPNRLLGFIKSNINFFYNALLNKEF